MVAVEPGFGGFLASFGDWLCLRHRVRGFSGDSRPLSGCVMAPPPRAHVVVPVAPPVGVAYVAPVTPAPGPYWHWSYHPQNGYGWYHHEHGWRH